MYIGKMVLCTREEMNSWYSTAELLDAKSKIVTVDIVVMHTLDKRKNRKKFKTIKVWKMNKDLVLNSS